MSLHLSIPAVVAAVGALGYMLLPGKWAELSKIAFGAGMIALLMGMR